MHALRKQSASLFFRERVKKSIPFRWGSDGRRTLDTYARVCRCRLYAAYKRSAIHEHGSESLKGCMSALHRRKHLPHVCVLLSINGHTNSHFLDALLNLGEQFLRKCGFLLAEGTHLLVDCLQQLGYFLAMGSLITPPTRSNSAYLLSSSRFLSNFLAVSSRKREYMAFLS